MNKIGILFVAILVISSFPINVNAANSLTSTSDTKIILANLINQDPDPSIAGETFDVRIGIQNVGGKAANNVVLEIVPEYPFEPVTGHSLVKNIGTLNAYQDENDMYIVKFTLKTDKDAVSGTYPLKVLQYEEGKKEEFYTTNDVNIEISNNENAEIIYIDKTDLIPGKQEEVKFTIKNVGSAPLKDLTFSWTNEDDIILPVGSDNTKYIKYIDVGESADVVYNVVADNTADAGLYKLDLTLKYGVSGLTAERTLSTVAGIYVGGGTDFDIVFSDQTDDGMSFAVANIGSNPAYSVSVSVPKQQGWTSTGSSATIIGNLNNGDYTIATFGISKIGRTDNLVVNIKYTNTKGERITLEKTISLSGAAETVTSKADSQMQSTDKIQSKRAVRGGINSLFRATPNMDAVYSIVAVIVAIVVISTVGLYYKKRKKTVKSKK